MHSLEYSFEFKLNLFPILGSLLFCEVPPPSINSQEFSDFEIENDFVTENECRKFDNSNRQSMLKLEERTLSSKITEKELAQCVARKLEEKESKKLEIEEPMYLDVIITKWANIF